MEYQSIPFFLIDIDIGIDPVSSNINNSRNDCPASHFYLIYFHINHAVF